MKKQFKTGAVIIEGHVQGLSNARALGESGIPVIVIDTNNCLARYSKYCSKFYYCPEYTSDKFIEFLLQLGKREHLEGWSLIPSNDHAVISLSKNKDRLTEIFKVITPEISVVEKIYDKSILLEIAESCKIPIPRTFYLDSLNNIPDQIDFPVIVKGKQGLSFYKSTGKKGFLSNNRTELEDHLCHIEKVFSLQDTLIQELIPSDGTNKTISFTAFSVEGDIKAHWIGEKVREHPLRFGTATFARSIECKELFVPGQQLLNKLKYTGVCEIEFLFDPRDKIYKLIEINARTWLWVGLAKICGVNYALLIYNYLNGIENVYSSQYQSGIAWVNFMTDVPFSMVAILKRRLSIREYFLSFKGRITNAIFSWKDIFPGILAIILSIYIAIKRS